MTIKKYLEILKARQINISSIPQPEGASVAKYISEIQDAGCNVSVELAHILAHALSDIFE